MGWFILTQQIGSSILSKCGPNTAWFRSQACGVGAKCLQHALSCFGWSGYNFEHVVLEFERRDKQIHRGLNFKPKSDFSCRCSELLCVGLGSQEWYGC